MRINSIILAALSYCSLIRSTKIEADLGYDVPLPLEYAEDFKEVVGALLSPLDVFIDSDTRLKLDETVESLRFSSMIERDSVLSLDPLTGEHRASIPVPLLTAILDRILMEVPIRIATNDYANQGREFEVDVNTQTLSSLLKRELPDKLVTPVIDFQTYYSPRLVAGSCPGSLYTSPKSNCLELMIGFELLNERIELLLDVDFEFKSTINYTRLFVNSIRVKRYNDSENELIYVNKTVEFLNDVLELIVGVINNRITHKTNGVNRDISLICRTVRISLEDAWLYFTCRR